MLRHQPTECEGPVIYSLDRRGPDDPRFGTIHLVLVALLAALAVAAAAVL